MVPEPSRSNCWKACLHLSCTSGGTAARDALSCALTSAMACAGGGAGGLSLGETLRWLRLAQASAQALSAPVHPSAQLRRFLSGMARRWGLPVALLCVCFALVGQSLSGSDSQLAATNRGRRLGGSTGGSRLSSSTPSKGSGGTLGGSTTGRRIGGKTEAGSRKQAPTATQAAAPPVVIMGQRQGLGEVIMHSVVGATVHNAMFGMFHGFGGGNRDHQLEGQVRQDEKELREQEAKIAALQKEVEEMKKQKEKA
mmetsp:Transcript_98091/g.211545  ORF Transcript_98091/g.211545 Transcript_98091/m.211545 type:complete len:254 (+) Transcript_98091:934-1695(+)